MRKILSPALVLLLVAAVGLTGCATKKWVNEQVSANQKAISELAANQAALETEVAKLSDTAQDALMRAEKANKLAKGKFLYEETLAVNDVTFNFNQASLTDNAKAALDAFSAKVKGLSQNAYVEIQGHTDNIGSEAYNLKLGQKRADVVMRYLNMELGIPLFRMNSTSYGEYKPIADNSTKAGRAANRRVTLVVFE